MTRMQTDDFRFNYPLLYEWDCRVLENCTKIAYAADWLREETLDNFQVEPSKLAVVPFGACLFPTEGSWVEEAIRSRQTHMCNLTFVGVDWTRKGLALAHELLVRLNRTGLPTRLTVIGCQLQVPSKYGDFCYFRHFSSEALTATRIRYDPKVCLRGYLRKDDLGQYERYLAILGATHFLVHPSSFECFGVVMAEANAVGVPVIATHGFGPSSIVKEGINGHLFSQAEFVNGAAGLIGSLLSDHQQYIHLSRKSFDEYRDRLNWPVCSDRLLQLVS